MLTLKVKRRQLFGSGLTLGVCVVDLHTLATGPVQHTLTLWQSQTPAGFISFKAKMLQISTIRIRVSDLKVFNVPQVSTSIVAGISLSLRGEPQSLSESKLSQELPACWKSLPELRFTGTIKDILSLEVIVEIWQRRPFKSSKRIGSAVLALRERANFVQKPYLFQGELILSTGSLAIQGSLCVMDMPCFVNMTQGCHTDSGIADGVLFDLNVNRPIISWHPPSSEGDAEAVMYGTRTGMLANAGEANGSLRNGGHFPAIPTHGLTEGNEYQPRSRGSESDSVAILPFSNAVSRIEIVRDQSPSVLNSTIGNVSHSTRRVDCADDHSSSIRSIEGADDSRMHAKLSERVHERSNSPQSTIISSESHTNRVTEATSPSPPTDHLLLDSNAMLPFERAAAQTAPLSSASVAVMPSERAEDRSVSTCRPVVAKLPEGYEIGVDRATGATYFHDRFSGVLQSAAPKPLPDGWERCLDKVTNMVYFKNHITSSTQWEPPMYRPSAGG